MRIPVLALAAIVLIPLLVLDGQFGFMTQAQPIKNRAGEIWSAAQPIYSRCKQAARSPSDMLARVLVAIEIDRTGKAERFLQDNAARLAIAIGLPSPDFSLGIAQIKPSALRTITGTGPVPGQDVLDLLNDCEGLKTAGKLVQMYQHECHQARSLPCRLTIARRFNGQKSFIHPNIAYLMIVDAVYRNAVSDG